MKVSIKTLEGRQFDLEVEGSDTVDALKQKIETEHSIAVDTQKLIFKGKILAEGAKTMDDYGIKDKDFLVIMVSKPKAPAAPKPAAAPAAPQATPASTPAAQPAAPSQPAPATPASATSAAATPATPTAAAATGGDTTGTAASMGPDFERNVTTLLEMGFEREQVVRALRAAFNNPDRAVDYLMSGNIPNINQDAPRARPAAPPAASGAGTPSAPSSAPSGAPSGGASAQAAPSVEELLALASILSQGTSALSQLTAAQVQTLHRIVTMHATAMRVQQGGAGAASGPGSPSGQQLPPAFAALRNNPVFQQMRQLVRQNPAMLQPLLQQLAQTHPPLVQAIQANPQAFLQLLEADEGEGGMGGPMPGVIQVTQAEKESIDRLVALGFDRSLAIQAFFACDKQEDVAANYLFEHGHDFDGDDGDDGGDDGQQ